MAGGSGAVPLTRERRRRRRGADAAAGSASRGCPGAAARFTLAPTSPSAQSAPSTVCTSTRQTTIEEGAPPTGGLFWVSVQRA
jgi:hypothetical protein